MPRHDASRALHSKQVRRNSKSIGFICESLGRRLLMAAGDPDFGFSGDGRATLTFPGDPFVIADSAVAPDGKVVVAGTKGPNMAVARLNQNGTIDTSFGIGGLYQSNRRPAVTSVAVQGDGKIILGLGRSSGSEHIDLNVGRLLSTGTGFDSTFGTNGIAHAGEDHFFASNVSEVAVQRDGRIIGGGEVENGILNDYDFAVVRYTVQGQLDTTFAGDGVCVEGLGGELDRITGLTIDYNGNSKTNSLYGSIVVVGADGGTEPGGTRAGRFLVMRLLPHGGPDHSFDFDGKLTSPDLSGAGVEYATGVVVQPGGKIVVAGHAVVSADTNQRNFLISRYTVNGGLDTSFANNGVQEIDLGGRDEVGDIAIGYHNTVGNLVVAGSRNGQFALVALRANGQLDTRFHGDGILTTTIAGHATGLFATGNLFPPIRKLIVAGGNGQIARFIDVGSVISIGTFEPNMYEQGAQGTSFIVGHGDPVPIINETIFLTTSGEATPRGTNRDFNSQNILYGIDGFSTTEVTIPANNNFANVILTPVDDTMLEGDESITFTLLPSAAYDIGNPSATTLVVRDNDNVGGPVVISSSFVWQTAPQRVRFKFSKDVSGSLSAADFQFTGPGPIPPRTFSYDTVTNTATLSFNGVLRSGNFTARAVAAGISSAQGEVMPADHVLSFSFLNGDTDQNGVINFDDYARIDNGFNNGLIGFINGDFNYDGVINFDDYAIIDLAFNSQ